VTAAQQIAPAAGPPAARSGAQPRGGPADAGPFSLPLLPSLRGRAPSPRPAAELNRWATEWWFAMKRGLIRIAIFVIVGAVVNIAVAWGCSAFAKVGTPLKVRPTAADEAWFRAEAPFPLTEHWQVLDEVVTIHGFGQSIRGVLANDGDKLLEGALAYRHDVGWPAASLRFSGFSHRRRHDDGSRTQTEHCVGRIRLPWASSGTRFGQADILWSAFVANSLLYATMLWLLVGGPFALRRILRVKRGLCARCAYPIGDSPLCTECGKPVATCSVA
jgi:hypothetical protein